MSECRNPIKITAEALAHKPTSDQLEITHDPNWSEIRSGRAGRAIHCYAVRNVTKGTLYDAELFVGDDGGVYGWDSCPSTSPLPCKHLRALAKKLIGTVINGRAK